MITSNIAAGIAVAACLSFLPLSAASPSPAGDSYTGDEIQVEDGAFKALFTSFLNDAENKTVYACNGECAKEGCTEACPYANSPAVKLQSAIVKSPEALVVLRPLALEAMASKKTTEAQSAALIGLLVDSRQSSVVPLAEAMFERAPDRFCCTGLLSFCELGSEDLVKPLTKRVKKGKAGVAAATFLALDGNKAGAKVLKAAAHPKFIDCSNALDVLLAGRGLEALGQDGAAHAARLDVHKAVLAALDAGEMDCARGMAAAATVSYSASTVSKPMLSAMARQAAATVEAITAKGKWRTAEEIFEAIEEVTPIG